MSEATIPTSEVLDRAADLIEERGWTVGMGWGLEGASGGLCLEGGILAATGLVLERSEGGDFTEESFAPLIACPAYRAVHEYLALDEDAHLYRWNDKRDRTKAEVIATLRAASAVEATKEAAELRPRVGSAW